MLSTSIAHRATSGLPSVLVAGAPVAVTARMLEFTVKVRASLHWNMHAFVLIL